jgi:hypothetical protein
MMGSGTRMNNRMRISNDIDMAEPSQECEYLVEIVAIAQPA